MTCVIYAADYDTNSNKPLLRVLILAMMPCVRVDELLVIIFATYIS